RIAWLYAALSIKAKAAAAFYGRLEGGTTPLTPKQPLDYAGGIRVPVIGFYGGKDTGISLESIEKMRLSLEIVDSPSELVVYPNAQHGFYADYRPSYSKVDAEDAWKRTLAWFKRNGV
ncbi:MAG: dienelactone hydrolase family protein, partial [Acidobacteriota bacterium]